VERIERGFSSLAGCYALLASLAASFLVYAHRAFLAHPHWASPDGLVGVSSPGQALHVHQVTAIIQNSVLYLRERMHTSWLFCGVFAAVWLACLLWMHFGRRGRGLAFNRHEALWIGGISLLIVSAAALYGLGTKGIVPHRIPALVPVSDAFAVGFILSLPVIIRSRIRRRHEEAIDLEFRRESGDLSARSLARLGLGDDAAIKPLADTEIVSQPEIKLQNLVPAVQGPHSDDHPAVAANRLVARLASPVALAPQEPVVDATPQAVSMMSSGPTTAALLEPVLVMPATVHTLSSSGSAPAIVPELIEAEIPQPIAEPVPLVSAEPVTSEPVSYQRSERIAELATEPHMVVSAEPIELAPAGTAEVPAPEPVVYMIPESAPVAIPEPVAAIHAAEFIADLDALQIAEPIAEVMPKPTTVALPEPVAISLEEPAMEPAATHSEAEPVALHTYEPMAMVVEEPVAVAILEPVAFVAEEHAVAPCPEEDVMMPWEPVADSLPLPDAVATLEPIAKSADPIAVASMTLPEPETGAQLEPLPVSAALVEPIAAVAGDPIALLPAVHIAVAMPTESVTVPQPEPLLISVKPTEPIAAVPREPISVVPPVPVAVMPPKPKPTPQSEPPASIPAREMGHHSSLETGDEFLHGLSTLNRSWRRIETMQEEMDEWFKQRRRQALLQAATPPGMRNSSLGNNLVQDLSERMAAIDAQWAEIRNAALGISQAVGDVAPPDRNTEQA